MSPTTEWDPERVERQHLCRRRTMLERVDALLDPGTWSVLDRGSVVELGREVAHATVTALARHGARALAAVYQASALWANVLVCRVFGVVGAAHRDHTRHGMRVAWPSADWGSLPVEGGLATPTAEKGRGLHP